MFIKLASLYFLIPSPCTNSLCGGPIDRIKEWTRTVHGKLHYKKVSSRVRLERVTFYTIQVWSRFSNRLSHEFTTVVVKIQKHKEFCICCHYNMWKHKVLIHIQFNVQFSTQNFININLPVYTCERILKSCWIYVPGMGFVMIEQI